MKKQGRVHDMIAIVTGAGSGIGVGNGDLVGSGRRYIHRG